MGVSRAFGTKQPERTHKEKHELHRCTHASSDEEEENRTACEGGSCQQPRNPEAAGTPWCDMKGRRPPAPDPLLQKPGETRATQPAGRAAAPRPKSPKAPWTKWRLPRGAPTQRDEGRRGLMAAGPRCPSPPGGPATQVAAWRRRRGRYPPPGILIRLVAGCLPPGH